MKPFNSATKEGKVFVPNPNLISQPKIESPQSIVQINKEVHLIQQSNGQKGDQNQFNLVPKTPSPVSGQFNGAQNQSAMVTKKESSSQLIDSRNIISSIGMSNITQQQQDKSKWEWMPCTFFLKQNIGDRTIVWSLNPTVMFGNPRNDQAIPLVSMNIWMDRPFIYDEELGWNWHKSWILPTLCIKLEIIDPNTKEVFNPPKNTYAQIYAVKAATKDISNFHLIDIGLKGNDRISLENGTVTFSAIKFTSTSYNNDGTKFNLVVAITIQNENEAHPRIIEAKISPPIFVDSRKSARETQSIKDCKLTSFYELFQPEIFSKILIKRKKKENESVQEEIQNDIGGFTNYFTAPNIRNKVKHPFFLAYKFSNCVQLYYNSEVFQTNKTEEIVDKTLNILMEYSKNKVISQKTKKSLNGIDKLNNNAYISLVLNVSTQNNFFMNKKIGELLGPLDNAIVNIIFDSAFLPEKYKPITDMEGLKRGYEQSYQKYYKKGKGHLPSKQCYDQQSLNNSMSSMDSQDELANMKKVKTEPYSPNMEANKNGSPNLNNDDLLQQQQQNINLGLGNYQQQMTLMNMMNNFSQMQQGQNGLNNNINCLNLQNFMMNPNNLQLLQNFRALNMLYMLNNINGNKNQMQNNNTNGLSNITNGVNNGVTQSDFDNAQSNNQQQQQIPQPQQQGEVLDNQQDNCTDQQSQQKTQGNSDPIPKTEPL